MTSNNIFKKTSQSDFSFKKSELSEYKSDIYIPPAKRNITNVTTTSSERSNVFLNTSTSNRHILNYKTKSRPLYRVTEDKINSLELFPELNKSKNIEKGDHTSEQQKNEDKKQWIKQESTVSEPVKCEKMDEKEDNSKLYVPDSWLLL